MKDFRFWPGVAGTKDFLNKFMKKFKNFVRRPGTTKIYLSLWPRQTESGRLRSLAPWPRHCNFRTKGSITKFKTRARAPLKPESSISDSRLCQESREFGFLLAWRQICAYLRRPLFAPRCNRKCSLQTQVYLRAVRNSWLASPARHCVFFCNIYLWSKSSKSAPGQVCPHRAY